MWRRGDRLTSGVARFAYQTPTDGLRLVAMTDWLASSLKQLEAAGEALESIAYEQINFVGRDNGPAAMHAHGKQLGALQRWAAFRKLPEPEGLPWNTVKKHVTGHGSASRETVLAAVQRIYPHVKDHNEASAVAVMLTARHLEGEGRA